MKLEYKNLYIERKGGPIPILPYKKIKEEILGIAYNLNVIFCPPTLSQKLNHEYRNKDYPTNILSFPLDKSEGEIYIQLQKARQDAKKHNMSYNKFTHLLYIHGCLHLIGHDHSDEMDNLEDKYLKIYCKTEDETKHRKAKNETKHKSKLDRHRHRY